MRALTVALSLLLLGCVAGFLWSMQPAVRPPPAIYKLATQHAPPPRLTRDEIRRIADHLISWRIEQVNIVVVKRMLAEPGTDDDGKPDAARAK